MVICPECGKRWTCLEPPEYWVTNAGAQVVERLCYRRMVAVYQLDTEALCPECLDSWLLKKSLERWACIICEDR